jgi:tight adherence protein B
VTTVAVVATVLAARRVLTPTGRSVGSVTARPAWVPSGVRQCLEAIDRPVDVAVAARTWAIVVVSAPALVWVVAGPPLSLAAAAAILLGPRLVLPSLVDRRTARRDDQLAPYLERVASSIRSGQSMRSSVIDTARHAERPLAAELEPLADALDNGASLDDALAHWASAPRSGAEVRLAAAALQLGARAGGEVARAVDAVASTLRERREVRGETVALATQARMSALLLVVAPLGFAGLVSTIEPGAVQFLLGTPVGLACLVGGLGLDAVGGIWMQRIVRGEA